MEQVDRKAPYFTAATLKRRPTRPGEMLLEEFLRTAGITQVALAAKMGVPIQRVNGIISGRRAVTAEAAILAFPRSRDHAGVVAQPLGGR